MNKRIKELWRDCVLKHTNDPMNWQMAADEFAELIVRETMQVVANQLPSNQYLDVAHAVIEHFGVEE